MALVLVLLFTLVVLTTVLATVALAAQGARHGAGTDRQSYQALLAAESGLNSFPARLQEAGFTGMLTDLPCRVQGAPLPGTAPCPPGSGELGTLLLGPESGGPRAELHVVALSAAGESLTLRSVGHGVGGARATLLQDFRLRRPVGVGIAPPAAFGTCGDVALSGRAQSVGVGVEWPASLAPRPGTLVGVTTLVSASPSRVLPDTAPITVSVADVRLLDTGSVLRVGHSTFEVLGRGEGNTLQLAALVVPPGGELLSAGRALDLVPFALRAQATLLDSSTLRLPISDPSGFRAGDVLALDVDGVTLGATVLAQGFTVAGDPASGYVDVQPGHTAESGESVTPLPERAARELARGTPLWRLVPGQARTACGEALFLRVFGRPPREVLTRASRSDTLGGPVTQGVHWIGPADPAARAALSMPGGLCGEGLVIVAGDLTLGGAEGARCAGSDFRGLLYVMGHLNVQGAHDFLGAVVVEGGAVERSTAPDGAAGSPTWPGALSVIYDQAALLQAGRGLTPGELQAVPGSWRSR